LASSGEALDPLVAPNLTLFQPPSSMTPAFSLRFDQPEDPLAGYPACSRKRISQPQEIEPKNDRMSASTI
jgi:hypothetical protein